MERVNSNNAISLIAAGGFQIRLFCSPIISDRKNIALSKTRAMFFAVTIYLSTIALSIAHFIIGVSYLKDLSIVANAHFFFAANIVVWTTCLFSLSLLLDTYANGMSLNRLIIAVVGTLFVQMLLQNYSNGIAVQFVWAIVAYPRGLALRKVTNVILLTGGILLLITVFFQLAGYISTNDRFEHDTLRRALGFSNPNAFATTASSLIMIWVYNSSTEWNWRHLLAASGMQLIIFTLTDGVMAFVYGMLQVLLTSLFALYDKRRSRNGRVVYYFYRFSGVLFLLLWLLSLSAVFFFSAIEGTEAFSYINEILHARPGLWLYYYDEYGLSLLGKNLIVVQGFPFDNGFLSATISYGLLGCFLIGLLYLFLGKQNGKRCDWAMSLFVVLLLFHCTSESMLMLFIHNISIFALGAAVSDS